MQRGLSGLVHVSEINGNLNFVYLFSPFLLAAKYRLMSFWPLFCIFSVGIEGALGFIINVIVLILLCKGGALRKSYRITITVLTVYLTALSAICGVTSVSHLIHNDSFVLMFFGLQPPEIVCDVIVVIFVILVCCMWELTPASCILQCLSLCKPHLSDAKRLAIAYTSCAILVAWTAQYCTIFNAIPEYRQEFAEIARAIFDLNPEEKVMAYGAKLAASDKTTKSAINFAAFGVVPTYLISYALFLFCCIKIYRMLNSHGIDLSPRTKLLQQQFFRTLVLQALLPLVVLSLPIASFLVGIIGGFAMDRLSLFLTFSLYIVPTVQGCVSLSFVVKMKPSTPDVRSIARNDR